MSKFTICYFEGDGYDTVRFDSEEELNNLVGYHVNEIINCG